MKKLILIAVLASGCGSDAEPDPNSVTPPNAATNNVQTQGCSGMETLYEGECVVPSKAVFVSLTAIPPGLPSGLGAPLLCTEVLRGDEAEASEFITFHRVLEQTDECLVVMRVPNELQTPWPYAEDPDGFTAVTIRKDSDEWILDTPERLLEGCISTSTTTFEAFEFGATYQVEAPTGGADTTHFPATITIPEAPQQVCPEVVPGEPLEFTWTGSGSSSVRVSVRVGDIAINCTSEDAGSFTIPPDLTRYLPDTGTELVEVRSRNFEEHYNPQTGTLTTFVGEALGSCRD